MVRAAINVFLRRCEAFREKTNDLCRNEEGGCPECGYITNLIDDCIRAVKDALDARWGDISREASE